MQATTATDPVLRWASRRAAINRANSEHSTGPRTEAGKQRSSLNALRHGLTCRTAVLPTEDLAVYEQHCRRFRDEYQPATTTEVQLVTELANTSWRLNRIPFLEADLFNQALAPQSPDPSPQSLIEAVSKLGLYGARLSRQFQTTLDKLRTIQSERRVEERRDLREAASLLELHKHKGIPWDPAEHGFVFSKEDLERHALRLTYKNEAFHFGHVRFDLPPALTKSYI
jgi:hypothetical protein